jgi:flagellum-specific peptidoglycan hydrolase FlgJ
MKLKLILFASLFVLSSFTVKKETEPVSLTHEVLYEQINELKIKFPDIVFAQAVLESGHFQSQLFINQNNLFGMKAPKRRETTAVNKGKQGYALYDTWTSSLYDYQLWQQSMLKNRENTTRSQYFALLGRVYASDKKYVSSLKRVISQNQEILN